MKAACVSFFSRLLCHGFMANRRFRLGTGYFTNNVGRTTKLIIPNPLRCKGCHGWID
jgi:hypothetical protein